MKAFDLSGKVAVVIGGTAGLGKVISLGLASAGATVVASSRSDHSVSEEIAALGVETLQINTDVRSRTSIQQLHDAVLEKFGRVDLLFNCAGVTKRISTLDCPEEVWDEIMDINLKGTLRSCQIFGATMLKQGFGRVINIASLSSFIAFQEVAAYGASKAAVAALTRSLAVEWAPRGVYVNAIAPGIFPTALNTLLLDSPRGVELKLRTPMRRFGLAEELVSTALYLSSDENSFLTGQVITVDGGFMASGVNS